MAIKDQEVHDNEDRCDINVEDSSPDPGDDSRGDSKSNKQLRQFEVLKEELESERRKSSDLANRMRYLQADIANMQRQADRRVSEVRNQVKLTWILEILSIKEDLDRAVGVSREANEKSSLLDGLLLVTSRIENILKLESVEVIRAEVGGRFDPNLHEALAFQESEKEEQGTILSVISLGYSVDGKVIKPAMVEVARRKEKRSAKKEGNLSESALSPELEMDGKAGSNNP